MSNSDDIKKRFPVYQLESQQCAGLPVIHARYIEECTRLRQAYEEWKVFVNSRPAGQMVQADILLAMLDAAMKGKSDE